MTDDLFRKVQETVAKKTNQYLTFGLEQNPFPAKPSVTVGSPDKRNNGSIYLTELRKTEETKFEQLLIPTSASPQTRQISFLMDYATRRGRGIGKTAFLQYQSKRINEDFGKALSRDSEFMFSAYALPTPDGKTRKFWQFQKLLVHSLIKNEIIAAALWRLRGFSGAIPEKVLNKVKNNPQDTIGNNEWLQSEGVNVFWELNKIIKTQLQQLGIDNNLAEILSQYGHLPNDLESKYFHHLSDFFWNKNDGQLLFNDLVKVLMSAGFTKGLFFVDEIEKIITPQNTLEKRAFTDSLRYFFLDGQTECAKHSFYSLLLTIHPYVQELLNPHWSATGLDRFAVLSGDLSSEYTIYFEPLNQEFAEPLAIAYLDESRINENEKGTLKPFTKKALEQALLVSDRVPGIFLSLLNHAIEKAMHSNWKEIGAEQIIEVANIRAPSEPTEADEIENLPPAEVNLKG